MPLVSEREPGALLVWSLTGAVYEQGTNLETLYVERPFLLPVSDDEQILADLADAAEALTDFSGSLAEALAKLAEWGFVPPTGEETIPGGLDWPALIERTLADLEWSAGDLGWAERNEPPPDRDEPPPGEPVPLCPPCYDGSWGCRPHCPEEWGCPWDCTWECVWLCGGGNCCAGTCCAGLCCSGHCCAGTPCAHCRFDGTCASWCPAGQACCNGGCCDTDDRCCCDPSNPCCGSDDPCCDPGGPCCGNPDPCCNPDNPDCGDCTEACCHSADPCCNNPDPCCGVVCEGCSHCVAGTCVPGCGACSECVDDQCVPKCQPGETCCPPPSGGCCDGTCCVDVCCSGPCDVCSNGADPPLPPQWVCSDVCAQYGQSCCGGTCYDPQEMQCCSYQPERGDIEYFPCGLYGSCCEAACCPSCQTCEDVAGQPTCLPKEECAKCDGGAGRCVSETCEPVACRLVPEILELTACPGVTVTAPVTVLACSPYCVAEEAVGLSGVDLPPDWMVFGSASCVTGTGDLTVNIPPDALVDHVYDLTVRGWIDGDACGEITLHVTVRNLVDLEFEGVTEPYEEDPGGFLCLNDDDDNNDGIPDKDEPPGPPGTAGEDELRPVRIKVDLEVTTGTVELVALPISGGRVKLYESPDRSNPLPWPNHKTWDVSELPIIAGYRQVTVWVEGTEVSNFARDVHLHVQYIGPGGPCDDWVTLTVVHVAAVEWDEFEEASTPLDGCPNNGGVRMFPDKRYPVDPAQANRNKVALLATIEPVFEGVPVRFRVWDVDDPFDQNNPAMPNVHLIDGDTSGPDNRLPGGGPDPAVGQWTASTDAGGQARLTVTVSMQPGNNYRGGASTILDALDDDQVTQAEVDANAPVPPVALTEMLTVWRKVWLELDSMGPGTDISYTGLIDEITNNSPHPGDGTIEFDGPDIDDDGRFEGGTMSVPFTGNSYVIIDNVDVFIDDDYTMSTLVAAEDLNKAATVVDDDTAVLPKTPDANLAVLNDKYRNCYLEFIEDPIVRDNNNVFVATLARDGSVIATKGLENADLTPAPNFWLAIVVEGYQCHHDASGDNATTGDGDPDRLYHIHGTASQAGDAELILGIAISNAQNVCLFFLETNQDFVAQGTAGYWPGLTFRPLDFIEPRVIAHEVAHIIGLPDRPASGTLMAGWSGADSAFDALEVTMVRSSQSLDSHER